MKILSDLIQKRIRGILLLGMLIIPFFLYAAARSESSGTVYFLLILMIVNTIVAMRSA